MCEVVLDFGNDVEMRALFKRQGKWQVPFFTVTAICLTSIVAWLWVTKPDEFEYIMLLVLAADLLAVFAVIQAKTMSYADWMKTMPQRAAAE